MKHNTAMPDLDAEAADWVVRLGASLSREDRQAFDRWLSSSEAHRRAYTFAQETWAMVAGAHELAPIAESAPGTAAGRNTTRPRRPVRATVLALAASLFIAIAVTQFVRQAPWAGLTSDHHTGIGQISRVELPDGSIATLDTDSALVLNYDDGARSIRLLRGTASFEVAAIDDPQRHPFIVEAAGGKTQALGTRFIVSHDGSGAVVRVTEHSVAVTLDTTSTAKTALVVQEGESVRYSAAGIGEVASMDTAREAGWTRGHLIFDHTPLHEAVAEINRYRREPIVVLDSTLAQRAISGVFRIDDLDGSIRLIASELDARLTEIPWVAAALY